MEAIKYIPKNILTTNRGFCIIMIQIGEILSGKPTYNLEKLKAQLKNSDTRHVTDLAYSNAVEFGYASWDEIIEAVVLNITPHDFYKTMPSDKLPGTFQDVYKKTINGVSLYIKLQEYPKGRGVVVNFKESTSKGDK
jgi:hypothetical protein